MKLIIVIFSALLFSGVSVAQSLPKEQGFLSLTIIKNGKVQASMPMVVGIGPGHAESGNSNGYPEVSCAANGRTLKSVTIFSGYVFDTDKVNNEIKVKAAGFDVEDQNEAIKALKENECSNLSPKQTQLFNKTVALPFAATPSPQRTELGNGYVLQWELNISKL